MCASGITVEALRNNRGCRESLCGLVVNAPSVVAGDEARYLASWSDPLFLMMALTQI